MTAWSVEWVRSHQHLRSDPNVRMGRKRTLALGNRWEGSDEAMALQPLTRISLGFLQPSDVGVFACECSFDGFGINDVKVRATDCDERSCRVEGCLPERPRKLTFAA